MHDELQRSAQQTAILLYYLPIIGCRCQSTVKQVTGCPVLIASYQLQIDGKVATYWSPSSALQVASLQRASCNTPPTGGHSHLG